MKIDIVLPMLIVATAVASASPGRADPGHLGAATACPSSLSAGAPVHTALTRHAHDARACLRADVAAAAFAAASAACLAPACAAGDPR